MNTFVLAGCNITYVCFFSSKRSIFVVSFFSPCWNSCCLCDCKIGIEHEKFGFEMGSLRPIKYEQIAELLNGISERFDWEKVMEGDYIIGLKLVWCFSLSSLLFLSINYLHYILYQVCSLWKLYNICKILDLACPHTWITRNIY